MSEHVVRGPMTPVGVDPEPRYVVRVVRTRQVEKKGRTWQRGAKGGEEYGYVDAVTPQEEELTLYEQTVDTLDLKAVISAVNGVLLPPMVRYEGRPLP